MVKKDLAYLVLFWKNNKKTVSKVNFLKKMFYG